MSWTKHSRQVKGQMLLKTRTLQNPAAWHQTSPPLTHTHTHSQSISHTLTHTGTRAKMPLFHPSPTIQPAVIPSPPPHPVSFSHSRITLCFFPDGGGEGGAQPRSCLGALILRHLLFFFIFLGGFFLSLLFFEDVLCSFLFPVLFFWREILLLITSISL